MSLFEFSSRFPAVGWTVERSSQFEENHRYFKPEKRNAIRFDVPILEMIGSWLVLGGLFFINFIEPPVQYIYHPGLERTKMRKRRPSGNGESSIHRGIMTESESIHLQIECYSLDWTDTKSNRFSAFPTEFTADKLLAGCPTPPLVKAVFVHSKWLKLENSKPVNWFQLRPVKINFQSNLASLCLIWTIHKRK